jgi:hypothetical protein
MQTVYKYPLQITDTQEVSLPFGCDVLTAGLDPQGAPSLWATVDTSQPPIPVTVMVVGTGNPIPSTPQRYISTFTQAGNVWHVFLG